MLRPSWRRPKPTEGRDIQYPPLRGAGRIADSSLPGHDLRRLATACGEKCGLLTTLVTCLTLSSRVDAHRLKAEAWLDEAGVRVVALYADSSPAPGATIQVFIRDDRAIEDDNVRGTPLFEDKLDGEGKFVFMPPAPRDLLCIIVDGAGHRVELKIDREHLRSLFDRPSGRRASGGANTEVTSGPIGVSEPPLFLGRMPNWVRILVGGAAIALLTGLSLLLRRSYRKHAS